MHFDRIAIIANPASTRNGYHKARVLEKKLHRVARSTPINVELIPTQYARHAQDLVYSDCLGFKRPLVISVSGDGGFHEVVEGVMRLKSEAKIDATVGLLKAGNANDHFHSVVKMSADQLIECALKGHATRIDLLEFRISSRGEERTIFTPSYAGFGLTAEAADQLSLRHYGPVAQYFLLPQHTFKRHRPIRIVAGGEERLLSSLSFHNIDRMAKQLKFPQVQPDNGKMAMLAIGDIGKLRIIKLALHGATKGFKNLPETSAFSFQVLDDTLAQFDGEVYPIEAGSYIKAICLPGELQALHHIPKAPEYFRGPVYLSWSTN